MKRLVIFTLAGLIGGCVVEERGLPNQAIADNQSPTTNNRNSLARGFSIDIDGYYGCQLNTANGTTIDQEFGPGSNDITRCLTVRQDVKTLYSVNRACVADDCAAPYAINNIKNAITDYEITHAMYPRYNYQIAVVLYSHGAELAINNNATDKNTRTNPFQTEVEGLIAKGVRVFLCQNAARSHEIKTSQLIPGVRYVTAGVTAIAELQMMGYMLVVP